MSERANGQKIQENLVDNTHIRGYIHDGKM